MSTIHVAAAEETQCSIAVDNGFADCLKLRDANPSLPTPLRPGDHVTLPDLTDKTSAKPTDAQHKFKRLGIPKTSVFIIQDNHRADPAAAAGDVQRQLAISNYVTGRQGTGYASAVWSNDSFSGYDAAASTDPDHFKILVRDFDAAKHNLAEVTVDLHAQKPELDASKQITGWKNFVSDGTSLMGLVCRRVGDTPYYMSCYLRLLADSRDQNGRLADGTDPADDRSKQTLVVPPLSLDQDHAIEILDCRILAERISPKCKVGDAAKKCRAYATAEVGKREMALRVKVYRIGGTASTITTDDVNRLLYIRYRMTLAQANLGIILDGDQINDYPLPNNMIAVSDYDGVKAKGDGTLTVRVAATPGTVTVTLNAEKKKTPAEIAAQLSAALIRKGVGCRISPNPPNRASSNDFGSCDILCFNSDATPARILSATSTDSHLKLAHTGAWNNSNVRDGGAEYGANEPNARLINGMDYRAAAKNCNHNNTNHLTVILVDLFGPNTGGGTLLGYALIPYRDVTARIRPIAELQMAVLLDKNGATRRTVLPHEAGHVLLDAIHTTNSTNPEVDWNGNAYPNNANLAFSEWMSAFSRESSPPFLHLRMSDSPLTVSIQTAYGNLLARTVVLGAGGLLSSVERLRTLSSSALSPMRQLTPAPVT